MGRRKDRIAKEDYSSDSGGSEDGEDEVDFGEFESFTQPLRRKKRRHGKKSKESAMLGIFGDESSEDDRDLMHKNIRYKEVSFVEKAEDEEQEEPNSLSEDEKELERPSFRLGGGLGFRQVQKESRESSASEDVDPDNLRPTMRLGVRSLGGGGSNRQPTPQSLRPSNDEEETYRPAFGFNQSRSPKNYEKAYRPALGFNQSRSAEFESTFASHTTTQSDTMHTVLPAVPEPSVSSARKGKPTSSSRKYGLGASMLEKMGYKEGKGLGSDGQGILNPIETKLRPERMGLGGVKEMTAQAKEEARRRGQVISDDEDEKRARRKKKQMGGGSGTSTPRGRARKVVYQTAEEIAGGMIVPATIQKLVDMQGREVDISSVGAGKMEDERRIAALARRDLERFGAEWKTLQEHRKYLDVEMGRMRDELAVAEERIRKIEEITSSVQQITESAAGPGQVGLSQVDNGILDLQRKVENDDVVIFGIDEAVIGIIQPMIKQSLVDWDPLVDATASGLITFLKSWSLILRIRTSFRQEIETEAESSLLHTQSMLVISHQHILNCRSTPYESLLYHNILPKIRSAINNSWTPYDPQPVINILEIWAPLLPGFIHNLLLEQVIIQKLRTAIDHWNPRRVGDSVHLWVFPWLPHLGVHMDDLVQTVRHKFKIVLETWDVSRGVVSGLEEWRELFGKGQLEELLLKHILPKLALELREKFVVDPSGQNLDVLENVVMPWRSYFRTSTWGQLLESEFFSKWLAMLHLWLTSEGVNLSEVGQWYEWWKHSVFPPAIMEMEGVRRGFNTGLDLMSKAADYADQGISLARLPAPVTVQGRPEPVTKPAKKTPRPAVARPVVEETTFRDVLEDFCAENNLLFISLRTANEDGKPLFRVTAHADGKGGVVGYIGKGDVLYVRGTRQGPFKPESLDRLPELAERR